MLVIKNYIIDDKKIHAKIEENKKKPKKVSGFSARLQKAWRKQKNKKGKKKINYITKLYLHKVNCYYSLN